MLRLVIDGNNLAYRNYSVMKALSDRFGRPTGTAYGFLTSLHTMVRAFKPGAVIVCWDGGRAKWRLKLYPEYKQNRKKDNTSDYPEQLRILKEGLEYLNICTLTVSDIEADDLVGILTAEFEAASSKTLIVSTDKDFYQLLSSQIALFKKGVELFTRKSFCLDYGIQPNAWPDVRALVGDASDNIQGVPSIGEKRALDLIRLYGSIDGILLNGNDSKQTKVIMQYQDIALRNRRLIMLPRSTKDPVVFQAVIDAKKAKMSGIDLKGLAHYCNRYNISSIANMLNVWEYDFQQREALCA